MNSEALNKNIGEWVNSQFGYFDYFDTRAFVVSAMNNTLKQDYPHAPYTAGEVIEWAKWNDKNSFFITAGEQAINGQKIEQSLFGKPKINPLTNKPNSKADTIGVVGKFSNTIQSGFLKLLFIGGVGVVGFYYLKSKGAKLGKQ